MILGLSATIKPVFFQKETRIYEIPMCLFVTGLLMYFCNTGTGISRQEAIILLILFCGFIGYTIYMGKRTFPFRQKEENQSVTYSFPGLRKITLKTLMSKFLWG